jgi:hypothetical protein
MSTPFANGCCLPTRYASDSNEYQIGITSLLRCLRLVFLLLALWADTIEIEPVAHNPKARRAGDLLGQLAKGNHFGINDLFALDADQMWMRVRIVPIVTITVISKAQFQDFSHLLEQRHSLVDCRQTGRWKIYFHRLVYLFYAGVASAGCQNSKYRNPLRREAVPARF